MCTKRSVDEGRTTDLTEALEHQHQWPYKAIQLWSHFSA
jgi:hypothetical protein